MSKHSLQYVAHSRLVMHLCCCYCFWYDADFTLASTVAGS